jgi:hypothetical protein
MGPMVCTLLWSCLYQDQSNSWLGWVCDGWEHGKSPRTRVQIMGRWRCPKGGMGVAPPAEAQALTRSQPPAIES